MTVIRPYDLANGAWQSMDALRFVNWDRYTYDEAAGYLCAFGWIDRDKDAYKDFVVIGFDNNGILWWQTSSQKYSKEISEILSTNHLRCNRIEEFFALNNVVKLNK